LWFFAPLSAFLKPEAFAIHFQNMHMVGEPIQKSSGKALGTKDLGPFIEWQIGCDDDGAAQDTVGSGTVSFSRLLRRSHHKPNISLDRPRRSAGVIAAAQVKEQPRRHHTPTG